MTDNSHELEHSKMTLIDHLEDLRKRIFLALAGLAVGMIAMVAFGAKAIIDQLKHPYAEALERMGYSAKQIEDAFITFDPTEGMLMYIKVVFVFGLILSAPWVFYQIWKFVSEGLYKKERKIVMTAVPFCAALFAGGALFYLYVVSIPMMEFIVYFSEDFLEVTYRPNLVSHVDMVLSMMLVFGLCFQLPVVMVILGFAGVKAEFFSRYRRHVIVATFILAAFVTTPSPVDQILLAVPMYILYELGIILVKINERKKRERIAEDDAYYAQLDAEIAEAEKRAAQQADEEEQSENAEDESDESDDYTEDEDDDLDDYYSDAGWYDEEYRKELEREKYGIFGRNNGEKFLQEDKGALGSDESSDFLSMMLARTDKPADSQTSVSESDDAKNADSNEVSDQGDSKTPGDADEPDKTSE